MKYKLIGMDLDGTLLGEQGRVSEANVQAIRAVTQAGAMVVPCTGRGWREAVVGLAGLVEDGLFHIPENSVTTNHISNNTTSVITSEDDISKGLFPGPRAEASGGAGVGIFNSGALVADLITGQHEDLAIIEPHLAKQLVDALADEPEAVLVYREANLTGHDYLVTGRGELVGNTQWWFEATGAKVHEQREVTADDLHHTLRVGMVSSGPRVLELAERINCDFAGRVFCHGFSGVKHEDERTRSIYVLEIFAAGVNKWRGLTWLMNQHGITADQVACLGDEINDVEMLREAGLGVAMGNATDDAMQAATVTAPSNLNDGVAFALYEMLQGRW